MLQPRPPIRRPTDNLQQAIPGVLLVAAVALVALGILMSMATYRTDSRLNTLKSRGVPVTYVVSDCASGRISSACSGHFSHAHHTYHDSLSGTERRPSSGAHVPALIDPKQPAAYVYARSAILGRRAITHSPWFVGGLVSLGLAIVLGALGLRLLRRGVSRRSAADPGSA